MFGFLQSCPHASFHKELEVLGHELPVHTSGSDELQTDGNRCSYFMEDAAETGRPRRVSSGVGLAESDS